MFSLEIHRGHIVFDIFESQVNILSHFYLLMQHLEMLLASVSVHSFKTGAFFPVAIVPMTNKLDEKIPTRMKYTSKLAKKKKKQTNKQKKNNKEALYYIFPKNFWHLNYKESIKEFLVVNLQKNQLKM